MKRILILGSDGFIGKNLKEHFEKKTYEIDAPHRSELDVSDEYAVKLILERRHYDFIFHAAVYNPRVGQDKSSSKEMSENLKMFFNLERYSGLYGKMFYFGSGAEFDKTKNICSVCESDFGNGIPKTDYGFYKYIINRAIASSNNIFNFRIFGLYGRHENWRKAFISGACCKALKDLPITMRQNVFFDYLYIDDFCKIMECLLEHDLNYSNYNIVSGVKVDLVGIANIVKEVSGKESLPIYICEDGLANEYTASNSRLINEIGEFPFTPMRTAIESLYVWYREREEEIDLYSLLYQ